MWGYSKIGWKTREFNRKRPKTDRIGSEDDYMVDIEHISVEDAMALAGQVDNIFKDDKDDLLVRAFNITECDRPKKRQKSSKGPSKPRETYRHPSLLRPNASQELKLAKRYNMPIPMACRQREICKGCAEVCNHRINEKPAAKMACSSVYHCIMCEQSYCPHRKHKSIVGYIQVGTTHRDGEEDK